MVDITPYIASLPVVVTTIRLIAESAGNGVEKRLSRHLELLAATLDSSPAHANLSAVVDAESLAVRARAEARLNRKLNGANLAAVIVVVLLMTGIVWGLWVWSVQPMPQLAQVGLQIVAVVVGIFGTLLVTIGGVSQMWVPRDESPQVSEAADK